MNIAELLADAFYVLEKMGERVVEVRLSQDLIDELRSTGCCDKSSLWGAKLIVAPNGREAVLYGSKGTQHQADL